MTEYRFSGDVTRSIAEDYTIFGSSSLSGDNISISIGGDFTTHASKNYNLTAKGYAKGKGLGNGEEDEVKNSTYDLEETDPLLASIMAKSNFALSVNGNLEEQALDLSAGGAASIIIDGNWGRNALMMKDDSYEDSYFKDDNVTMEGHDSIWSIDNQVSSLTVNNRDNLRGRAATYISIGGNLVEYGSQTELSGDVSLTAANIIQRHVMDAEFNDHFSFYSNKEDADNLGRTKIELDVVSDGSFDQAVRGTMWSTTKGSMSVTLSDGGMFIGEGSTFNIDGDFKVGDITLNADGSYSDDSAVGADLILFTSVEEKHLTWHTEKHMNMTTWNPFDGGGTFWRGIGFSQDQVRIINKVAAVVAAVFTGGAAMTAANAASAAATAAAATAAAGGTAWAGAAVWAASAAASTAAASAATTYAVSTYMLAASLALTDPDELGFTLDNEDITNIRQTDDSQQVAADFLVDGDLHLNAGRKITLIGTNIDAYGGDLRLAARDGVDVLAAKQTKVTETYDETIIGRTNYLNLAAVIAATIVGKANPVAGTILGAVGSIMGEAGEIEIYLSELEGESVTTVEESFVASNLSASGSLAVFSHEGDINITGSALHGQGGVLLDAGDGKNVNIESVKSTSYTVSEKISETTSIHASFGNSFLNTIRGVSDAWQNNRDNQENKNNPATKPGETDAAKRSFGEQFDIPGYAVEERGAIFGENNSDLDGIDDILGNKREAEELKNMILSAVAYTGRVDNNIPYDRALDAPEVDASGRTRDPVTESQKDTSTYLSNVNTGIAAAAFGVELWGVMSATNDGLNLADTSVSSFSLTFKYRKDAEKTNGESYGEGMGAIASVSSGTGDLTINAEQLNIISADVTSRQGGVVTFNANELNATTLDFVSWSRSLTTQESTTATVSVNFGGGPPGSFGGSGMDSETTATSLGISRRASNIGFGASDLVLNIGGDAYFGGARVGSDRLSGSIGGKLIIETKLDEFDLISDTTTSGFNFNVNGGKSTLDVISQIPTFTDNQTDSSQHRRWATDVSGFFVNTIDLTVEDGVFLAGGSIVVGDPENSILRTTEIIAHNIDEVDNKITNINNNSIGGNTSVTNGEGPGYLKEGQVVSTISAGITFEGLNGAEDIAISSETLDALNREDGLEEGDLPSSVNFNMTTSNTEISENITTASISVDDITRAVGLYIDIARPPAYRKEISSWRVLASKLLIAAATIKGAVEASRSNEGNSFNLDNLFNTLGGAKFGFDFANSIFGPRAKGKTKDEKEKIAEIASGLSLKYTCDNRGCPDDSQNLDSSGILDRQLADFADVTGREVELTPMERHKILNGDYTLDIEHMAWKDILADKGKISGEIARDAALNTPALFSFLHTPQWKKDMKAELRNDGVKNPDIIEYKIYKEDKKRLNAIVDEYIDSGKIALSVWQRFQIDNGTKKIKYNKTAESGELALGTTLKGSFWGLFVNKKKHVNNAIEIGVIGNNLDIDINTDNINYNKTYKTGEIHFKKPPGWFKKILNSVWPSTTDQDSNCDSSDLLGGCYLGSGGFGTGRGFVTEGSDADNFRDPEQSEHYRNVTAKRIVDSDESFSEIIGGSEAAKAMLIGLTAQELTEGRNDDTWGAETWEEKATNENQKEQLYLGFSGDNFSLGGANLFDIGDYSSGSDIISSGQDGLVHVALGADDNSSDANNYNGDIISRLSENTLNELNNDLKMSYLNRFLADPSNLLASNDDEGFSYMAQRTKQFNKAYEQRINGKKLDASTDENISIWLNNNLGEANPSPSKSIAPSASYDINSVRFNNNLDEGSNLIETIIPANRKDIISNIFSIKGLKLQLKTGVKFNLPACFVKNSSKKCGFTRDSDSEIGFSIESGKLGDMSYQGIKFTRSWSPLNNLKFSVSAEEISTNDFSIEDIDFEIYSSSNHNTAIKPDSKTENTSEHTAHIEVGKIKGNYSSENKTSNKTFNEIFDEGKIEEYSSVVANWLKNNSKNKLSLSTSSLVKNIAITDRNESSNKNIDISNLTFATQVVLSLSGDTDTITSYIASTSVGINSMDLAVSNRKLGEETNIVLNTGELNFLTSGGSISEYDTLWDDAILNIQNLSTKTVINKNDGNGSSTETEINVTLDSVNMSASDLLVPSVFGNTLENTLENINVKAEGAYLNVSNSQQKYDSITQEINMNLLSSDVQFNVNSLKINSENGMSSIIGPHLNLNGTYANTIYSKTIDNGISKENDKATSHFEFSSSSNLALSTDYVFSDNEQLKWGNFLAENNGISEIKLAVGNYHIAKMVDEFQSNNFTLNSTGTYNINNNSAFIDKVKISSSLSNGVNDISNLNVDTVVRNLSFVPLSDVSGFAYEYDEVGLLIGSKGLEPGQEAVNPSLISFLPLRDAINTYNWLKFLEAPSLGTTSKMIDYFCKQTSCRFSFDNGGGIYSNDYLSHSEDNSTRGEKNIYRAFQLYKPYKNLVNEAPKWGMVKR